MSKSALVAPSAQTSPYLRWGILAVLQLCLLSIPLADRLHVQMTGERVLLDHIPVDPRDLLRGDYVIISLAVTRVPMTVEGSAQVKAGDKVFVGLSSHANIPAQPRIVTAIRDEAGPVAIAGTVESIADDHIRVDYGIDAFFLPEGEGKQIERLEAGRVMLEVSVANDGRSLPIALIVDGKPYKSDAVF